MTRTPEQRLAQKRARGEDTRSEERAVASRRDRRFYVEEDCSCGAPEDRTRRILTDSDFHRLISHVMYGGHLCTPNCAMDALSDEWKGIPSA